ncbi:phage baseplate assembly protein V [Methylocystis sp. WRRC1]|uniref:phage baseplate assembly protein V n=1 Tax=unclassified Methylocystis TaxID=2625913 RepID=UPI0001F86A93|nr:MULTISPECIES: phage baseplate assembly protein V [unclassified Methylocystis]MCC3246140.1 phage baseplate assembly protein V [Methylocystis sp. WRRC1]
MSLAAQELRRARRELVRVNRRLALSHVEGIVAERDEKKWKVRLEIGRDEDDKPILSPWMKPHSNSAGAYKYSPPLPAVGDRMRMMSPSGIVGAASYAVPSAFDDELKRPQQDKDESAREYDKTRISQKKDSLALTTEKTSIAQSKEDVSVTAEKDISVKADKKASIEGEEARLKGKTSYVHGDSIDKIKFIVGGQAFRIREEALLPTSA